MNWIILILFCVLALSLIVFLIRRNQKDEKVFEKELDNDYPKSRRENEDIDMMNK